MNFFNDPSFQGVNRLFVLSFEHENGERHYVPTREMKNYNVTIDERDFFEEPLKII